MENTSPDALFEMPAGPVAPAAGAAAPLPPAEPRLRRADRLQVLLRPCSLEELLPAEHPARVVWAVVSRWDLGRFLAGIKARGEVPGRAATDPLILICLWLYAYTQNTGGGRELARLCEIHPAYLWILGSVTVNYHTLNDFRVGHGQALDDLLTQMLAALTSQDLVTIERVSFDGTRTRAGAGRSSFKTRPTLERHLHDARAHVEAMKQQAQDPNASLQRPRPALYIRSGRRPSRRPTASAKRTAASTGFWCAEPGRSHAWRCGRRWRTTSSTSPRT